jgi:hypothetical protein
MRIWHSVGLFTRRGGYCSWEPSVWLAEGLVCGDERSGVGWAAVNPFFRAGCLEWM